LNHYTVEISTTPGIADSDFLDRLAERVYDLEELVDPALGLNEDGSISASFDVAGADPLVASQVAVQKFVDAIAAAEPLTPADTALVGFAVTPAADREAAVA
jgi:hypothetical protein